MERLKQKVASSRLIASIQQAATGTFQQQQQASMASTGSGSSSGSGSGSGLRLEELRTGGVRQLVHPQQQQQQSVYVPQMHQLATVEQHRAAQQQQIISAQQTPVGGSAAGVSSSPASAPSSSAAWLMAADATAHLTEEEREILLEVFKKEEQFQRDTIKQMTASRAHLQTQPPGQCSNEMAPRDHQHHQQTGSGRIQQVGAASAQEREHLSRSRMHSNSNNNKENLAHNYSQGGPRSIRQHQQQQSIQSMSSSSQRSSLASNNSNSNSFASARSTTPLSRPSSSAFGTPTSGLALQNATSFASTTTSSSQQTTQQRTASSCSTVSQSLVDPLGQCRICRKFISANETCHLCSNCNQFICEDCASYSATDQHWMCSSCRRRTTKPAIPADALKELGLNQNSSAVRRMTLRLNQNELKLALNKGSSESTGSSSSSSGCSSMSVVASAQTNAAPLRTSTTALQSNRASDQHKLQQQSSAQPLAKGPQSSRVSTVNAVTPVRPPTDLLQQQQMRPANVAHRPSVQITEPALSGANPSSAAAAGQPTTLVKQQCDMRNSSQQQHHENRRGSVSATAVCTALDGRGGEKVSAQKTLSQPIGADNQRVGQAPAPSKSSRGGSAAAAAAAAVRPLPNRTIVVSGGNKVVLGGPHRLHQEQARRASIAIADLGQQSTGKAAGRTSAAAAQSGQQALTRPRKQSTAFFTQNSAVLAQINLPLTSQFRQSSQEQLFNDPRVVGIDPFGSLVGPNHQRHQLQLGGSSSNVVHHPQTMVTASSEASMNNDMLNMVGQQQQVDAGATLIPIPPDQIHLRRLSDQSNLVRRSSIIADTIDTITMARNRSHSNIDTVNYFYQSPIVQNSTDLHSIGSQQQQPFPQQQQRPLHLQQANLYRRSDDNICDYGNSLNVQYSNQQRRHSDQRDHRGHHLSGIGSAQPGEAIYTAQEYQQQHQQPAQQKMSSIITSYAQKTQHSSEEIHSDSSSDIEEDERVAQTGAEFENEQPSEYFAPPRALSMNYTAAAAGNVQPITQIAAAATDQMHQDPQMNPQSQAPISIPSVSVSEFSSSQQRLHHQQSLMQQQQQPSQQQQYDQIMTTPMQINVAIEQAIQQQQLQQQHQQHLSNDLLSSQTAYLMPRRGSSGRVLPKIPGEQSRSLLELPYNHANSANNSSGDQQGFNMLDLPCLSPTIRRASAPEGQNIKIVVDDIDGSMRGTGALGKPNRQVYGKQGELYERLVLYRDDSLDPNTNMARGFGLHVMGGKIDHDDKLQACVTWVQPGGPADKVGLKPGDTIIEWDGKCLVNATYEQVAETIESSANIAELLVKPAHRLEDQPGANYVRSQRRMSQQTERDLKKFQQQHSTATQFGQHQQQTTFSGPGQISGQQADQWAANQEQQPHHGQQQHHQHRLGSGQFQPPAISAGNSPHRSGTGRRLPQIPGMLMTGPNEMTTNFGLSDSALEAYAAGAGSAIQLDAAHRTASSGYHPHQHHLQHGGYHSTNQSSGGGSGGYDLSGGNTHLSALHDQQQHARSAGELYNTGGHITFHQQQQTNISGGLQNGSTPMVLNGLGLHTWQATAQPAQQQQTVRHTNGYNGYSQVHQPTDHYQQHYQKQQPVYQVGGRHLVAQDEICGLIGLQVNVDENVSQLEISVLSAININIKPSLDYYVRIRILPESNRFKACTTQPSSDMNWKETFIFQNFPTQQIQRMALEIGVWVYDDAPRLSTQIAQPICEAMIPIQSARERNTDFWPLRPPPTSPQARRKSLNDIIETYSRQENRLNEAQLSAGYHHKSAQSQWPKQSEQQQQQIGSTLSANKMQAHEIKYPSDLFTRERSSSNRNLPDSGKLRAQPRRASDEVAGSSSHRFSTRVSPAASRRSISVMNVGDGHVILNRSTSRLGSQSNILKAAQLRRDSNQLQSQQQQHQQIAQSASDSPVRKYTSPSGSVSRMTAAEAQAVGVTPTGRRSSLAGIQSMTGYRSQKNSQSDATDQDSPLRSATVTPSTTITTSSSAVQPKRSQPSTPKQLSSLGGVTTDSTKQIGQQQPQQLQQHRASIASVVSGQVVPSPSSGSGGGSGSRRGSNELPAQLQRKGSFAMLTLRKLKRTMSLNKGPEQEPGNNAGSRRSSSSSNNSSTDFASEDLGITRRIAAANTGLVGKLKLSFTMTKGQFEVHVICAQGLKYDPDSSMGVYVKIYLKGKSKSNKRKTRLVQPWESPNFKQLIKYDGSLVDNKLMEVSVWQKQGGLKGKIPIGFTEIRLSELNLGQMQTSWYNLRSMDVLSSSSVED